jgi:RNA polymerase sigma-70 factor, ECF subfamily
VTDTGWRYPFPLAPAGWPASDAARREGAPEAAPDELLLQRVSRGDERAFGELMSRHDARLREFVRYMLGAHARLAEDVMQEVLLQLHRSSPTFANGSTFRTWLYGLAKNVCRHELRRNRRDPAVESVGDEPLLQVPDGGLDPLEAIARDEREAAIRRAVEKLPDHYRIVLKLRDWDELSYAQIAETLDIPVGTVRSRLHNGRVLLAGFLDRYRPERER